MNLQDEYLIDFQQKLWDERDAQEQTGQEPNFRFLEEDIRRFFFFSRLTVIDP